MKLPIAEIRTNKMGFEQLAVLHHAAGDMCFGEVEFDFKHCTWFDANMAAPFGAILAEITSGLNDVKLLHVPEPIRLILSKNAFLRAHGHPLAYDIHGTVVPYQRFQLNEDRSFTEYVIRYTRGKGIPAMTDNLRRRFHESIGEIFANATLHSRSEAGVFCCGQYFPKKKHFDFCMADAGHGFVGAIEKAFGKRVPSVKALEFCLGEGNTTKKGTPGGLGLKLLKKFIEFNGGKIVIVSNAGYYQFSRDGEVFDTLAHPFPGTCVNIQIDTADQTCYRLSNE
jgi:hypothetical protein